MNFGRQLLNIHKLLRAIHLKNSVMTTIVKLNQNFNWEHENFIHMAKHGTIILQMFEYSGWGICTYQVNLKCAIWQYSLQITFHQVFFQWRKVTWQYQFSHWTTWWKWYWLYKYKCITKNCLWYNEICTKSF